MAKLAGSQCLAVPPTDTFDAHIEFEDGTEEVLSLQKGLFTVHGQWEATLLFKTPERATAYFRAEGLFPFGRHRHPCLEKIQILNGMMVERELTDKLLGVGDALTVPPNTYHNPVIISDPLELYVEWYPLNTGSES